MLLAQFNTSLTVPSTVQSTIAVQIGHLKQNGRVESVPGLVQERSELVQEINVPSKNLHVFSTAYGSYVDTTLREASLQSNPEIQIRVGLVAGQDVQWFPWQRHLLDSYSVERKGSGYVVVIKSTDGLGRMMRVPKTRSHRGTISSIIEGIASDNGLESVVEQTSGQRSYIQSNMTDGHFAVEKLRPRASNSVGRSNYGLWITDNILHFHTLTFTSKIVDLQALNLPGIQLVASSQVQDKIDDGAPGVNMSCVDVNSGRISVESSDPELAIRYENETVDFSTTSRIWFSRHVSSNQLDELKALAQSQYEMARLNMFSLGLSFSSGYNAVQLGDLIRTTVSAAESSRSSWSGLYMANRIMYVITRGAVSTSVQLLRGEFSNLAPQAENVAAGRPVDINAATKNSSRISKTSGSATISGQLVRSVESV